MCMPKYFSIALTSALAGAFGTHYYLTNVNSTKKSTITTNIGHPNPFGTDHPWNYNWDNRQHLCSPSKSYKNGHTGKRTVTLIRHGQYDRIEGGINDKQHLTENGKQQAILTAKRLNQMDLKFDKIYCSKFTRAMETASVLVSELNHNSVNEIEYDSDLNEGRPCNVEPFRQSKTAEQFQKALDESSQNIQNAFTKYIHRRDNMNDSHRHDILIIGHGNVFRYFLCKSLQFNQEGWGRFETHNASISRINIFDNGEVKVSHVGDTGHLPQHLLTSNWKNPSI
eukprot:6208_1